MDLVKKMIEAVETAITNTTDFHKLDVSVGRDTNPRLDHAKGFSLRPTALTQLDGGVGFLFFRQEFELILFDKLAYRGDSRGKVFEIYEELDKIFKTLYTVRVAGDNYQVVLTGGVEAAEPVYLDNYVRVNITFGCNYRRTGVFN